MIFFFLAPAGRSDPEAGTSGPGGQKVIFPRFELMILCSFLATIEWATPRNYRTKHMMVYDQITCFIICVFGFFHFFWFFGKHWKMSIRNPGDTTQHLDLHPSQSVTEPSQRVTDPSQSVLDHSQSVMDPSQSVMDQSLSVTDPSQNVAGLSKVLRIRPKLFIFSFSNFAFFIFSMSMNSFLFS